MPRRNKHTYRRYSSEANKEARNRSTLKIVRMVSHDDTAAINGVIKDLVHDESLPEFEKIPGNHPVFILDPRQVRKEFNNGFRAGFDCAKAREAARDQDGNEDVVVAKIGSIGLKGYRGRNLIIAKLDSPEITAERQDYFRILGEHGLRGFERRSHTTPACAEMFLGKLKQYAGPDLEQQIIETIETSFVIHRIEEIELGPSQVSVIN